MIFHDLCICQRGLLTFYACVCVSLFLAMVVNLVQTEFSPVHFLLPKQSVLLQIPATLQVYPHGLVVQMTDRMKVFELMATITEIYHISDIREVSCSCYV